MFGSFVTRHLLNRATRGKYQPGKIQALMRLPTLLRLGYALLRDERVPLWMRGGMVGILALIFSPIDLPSNIPLVGQLWDVTLAVTALDFFIQQMAPAHVVNEHITRLGLTGKIPLRKV